MIRSMPACIHTDTTVVLSTSSLIWIWTSILIYRINHVQDGTWEIYRGVKTSTYEFDVPAKTSQGFPVTDNQSQQIYLVDYVRS